MNSFVKASLIAAMMTAPLMADESFGGVGITIYQVREGVHVAEVIPGTPAAETNLRAGDIITSVDGVSLKGQNIEFSKSKLRGQVNKPLEITYTSNGETYSTVIRRAQIVSQIGRERNKICGIFESGVKDSVDSFYSEMFKVMTAPGVNFAIATT